VIAYRAGGALETVHDGETGLFFDAQEPGSLVEAVERFEAQHFSKDACREQAMRFSVDEFKRKLGDYVERKWNEHSL